ACGGAPRASPPPSSRERLDRALELELVEHPQIQLLRPPATFVDEHAGVEDKLHLRTQTTDLLRGGEPSRPGISTSSSTASASRSTATRTASRPSAAVPTTSSCGVCPSRSTSSSR